MILNKKQFHYISRIIVKKELYLRNKPVIEKVSTNCYKFIDVFNGILTICYVKKQKRNILLRKEMFIYKTQERYIINKKFTLQGEPVM